MIYRFRWSDRCAGSSRGAAANADVCRGRVVGRVAAQAAWWLLPQQQMMNGRAPARNSPLPAPVALDHILDPLLPPRSQPPFGNGGKGFQESKAALRTAPKTRGRTMARRAHGLLSPRWDG